MLEQLHPAARIPACEHQPVTPRPLNRRELLELIAIVALAPACKSERRTPPAEGTAGGSAAAARAPATALDATAYRTLDAMAARILPPEGAFPGAREAKVIDFIDRQLAIAPLSVVAPAVVAVARALDDQARGRRAPEFAKLAVVDQDAVIEALATGKLGTKLPERELFRILHGLVLEGFLCDPHHGGNHDQVAWRAIGFAEPTLRTPGASHDHHGKP
jgi:gluconate 2-dehydrogenase gamma chain